jgi:hypothetical protein
MKLKRLGKRKEAVAIGQCIYSFECKLHIVKPIYLSQWPKKTSKNHLNNSP